MSRAQNLKGKDLMIFIGGKALALATSCNLNLSATTEDSSTKDDGGWDNAAVTGHSWTASSDNVCTAEPNTFDQSYEAMMDACITGATVTLVFGVATNAADTEVPSGGWTSPTTTGYTGSAIIESVQVNAPNKQNATFTVNFKGAGQLTKQS